MKKVDDFKLIITFGICIVIVWLKSCIMINSSYDHKPTNDYEVGTWKNKQDSINNQKQIK